MNIYKVYPKTGWLFYLWAVSVLPNPMSTFEGLYCIFSQKQPSSNQQTPIFNRAGSIRNLMLFNTNLFLFAYLSLFFKLFPMVGMTKWFRLRWKANKPKNSALTMGIKIRGYGTIEATYACSSERRMELGEHPSLHVISTHFIGQFLQTQRSFFTGQLHNEALSGLQWKT